MLKFQVLVNKEFEDDKALVKIGDDETIEVVMQGDHYHDHIDNMIEGFFLGLSYAGIEFIQLDSLGVNEDYPLFSF